MTLSGITLEGTTATDVLVYIGVQGRFDLNDAEILGVVYVDSVSEASFGRFNMNGLAYVSEVYLSQYSFISVANSVLTSERYLNEEKTRITLFGIKEELINVTSVANAKNLVVFTYAQYALECEDYFELGNIYSEKFSASNSLEYYEASQIGGYTIYRYTYYIKLVKRADSIQIDPNGGVLIYDEQEYTEPFVIDIDENLTTLSFLKDIKGELIGYVLSSTYRSGNETYNSDSEIPILFTTLVAQWTRKDYIVATVPSLQAISSDMTGTPVGGNQVKGFNVLGKDYYTFDHYYLAYLNSNRDIVERQDITFIPNALDKVNFSLTYLPEEVYAEIDASGLSQSNYSYPTIFLVAVFTRNSLSVTINGNGGVAQEREDALHDRQVNEERTIVTYTYYQDEVNLSLASFVSDFGMPGYAIRDFNVVVYNDLEVVYQNRENNIITYVPITDATRVEITCNWFEVIAYVSRLEGNEEQIEYFGKEQDSDTLEDILDRLINYIRSDDEIVFVVENLTLETPIEINERVTISSNNDVVFNRSLALRDSMFIVGSKGNVTFVDTENTITFDARTSYPIAYSTIEVESGGILTLGSSVEIINNNTSAKGGGVYSSGTLTINGATITNNTTTNVGGGIYSCGYLTIL